MTSTYYDALFRSEYESYIPKLEIPGDFEQFWRDSILEADQYSLEPSLEPLAVALKTHACYDFTFKGYGGQTIHGWVLTPKNIEGRVPCVIEFIGYSGGRGLPFERLLMSSLGFAHVIMDTRGQGGEYQIGSTPDDHSFGGPQYRGFMTQGIFSPKTYYYRRVFIDAIRCVQAAITLPFVDTTKIAVLGGSQGGGISLAVCGLSPVSIKCAVINFPFLCHFPVAVSVSRMFPYEEIARFCGVHDNRIEEIFDTLSYFDGVHFAQYAKSKALFSVGLRDHVCPPITVYAAYNTYAGPKEIIVAPFNEHSGSSANGIQRQIDFLCSNLCS